MANLLLFLFFTLVVLCIGGPSDELYQDNQTSQAIYLGVSSIDLDSDLNDHDAVISPSYFLVFQLTLILLNSSLLEPHLSSVNTHHIIHFN